MKLSSLPFILNGVSRTKVVNLQCPFCVLARDSWIDETPHLFAIRDHYPVSKGHILIIPKKHRADFFELKEKEYAELGVLLHRLKRKIQVEDDRVSGFNIGANCGASAGQTVFHCHIHLIPRRGGDMRDPRGGVRGVIPSKRKYREKKKK